MRNDYAPKRGHYSMAIADDNEDAVRLAMLRQHPSVRIS
jgi:hypothetical protein